MDEELLKYAAKAARLNCDFGDRNGAWNPLIDDGDALRLAVNLGLSILQQTSLKDGKPVAAAAGFSGDDFRLTSRNYGGDPLAATRCAIVRAAAEIGKAMS